MPRYIDPNVETRIIDALARLGASSWHSRLEIARLLGRKRLNDSEITALNRLVASGRIETQQADASNTSMLQRHEYRLSSGQSEG